MSSFITHEYEGYLVYNKADDRQDADSDSDHEAEFNPEDFSMKKETVKLREATFVPLLKTEMSGADSAKRFRVKGRFHFTDLWWRIKFRVKSREKTAVKWPTTSLDGFFEYSMRNDPGVATNNVVMTFLSQSIEDDSAVSALTKYLRSRGLSHSLTFENMERHVKAMMTSPDDEQRAAAERIGRHVTVSDNAYYIRTAMEFPLVYQLGPKLFTRKFHYVLTILRCKEKEDEEEEEQRKAEAEMLGEEYTLPPPADYREAWKKFYRLFEEDYWKLGFYSIMCYEFKLRVEADIIPLIDTGLFKKMAPLHQDALLVYTCLKHSMFDGHTYQLVKDLRTHKALKCEALKAFYIKDLTEALTWLVDKGIVVRETRGNGDRVSLRRLYKYEERIAEGMAYLVERHKQKPLIFNVDIESPEFYDIRKDGDQCQAVKAICREPIVFMSGKGGCGKTATVSVLLKYVKLSGMLEPVMGPQQEGKVEQGGHENEMDKTDTYDMDVKTRTISSQGTDKVKVKVNANPAVMELVHSFRDEDFDSPMDLSQFENHENATENQNEAKEKNTINEMKTENETETENKAKREKEDEPIILLAAPTGKAASVLRKRSKLNAQTLHHVAITCDYWLKEQQKYPWKYRNVRVLVVDEGSMVAISIFSKVLTYLIDYAALEKLIVLGDILQLPAIEAGNFFSDSYTNLEEYKLSVPLTTNHRSSSHLIVENAARVQMCAWPKFDDSRFFHFIKIPTTGGGKFAVKGEKYETDIDWRIDSVVRPLIKDQPSLNDPRTSHFITFTKKRVKQLNELCCKYYKGHPIKNTAGKLDFQCGDKVVITRNASVGANPYDKRTREKEDGSGPDERSDLEEPSVVPSVRRPPIQATNNGKKGVLTMNKDDGLADESKQCWTVDPMKFYNGEIFFLSTPKQMSPMTNYNHSLEDPLQVEDDRVVSLDVLKNECELAHGWVTTIHKFQGSEVDTIAYVVHGGNYETWQHVYTAITRAKKRVFIIGTEESLRKALRNQPTKRLTNLSDLLKDSLKEAFETKPDATVDNINGETGEIEKVVEDDDAEFLFEDSQDGSVIEALDKLKACGKHSQENTTTQTKDLGKNLGGVVTLKSKISNDLDTKKKNAVSNENWSSQLQPNSTKLVLKRNSKLKAKSMLKKKEKSKVYSEDINDFEDEDSDDESGFHIEDIGNRSDLKIVDDNDNESLVKIDDFDSQGEIDDDFEVEIDRNVISPNDVSIVNRNSNLEIHTENKSELLPKSSESKESSPRTPKKPFSFTLLKEKTSKNEGEELDASADMFSVSFDTGDCSYLLGNISAEKSNTNEEFVLNRKRPPVHSSTPNPPLKSARITDNNTAETDGQQVNTYGETHRSPVRMAGFDGHCGLCRTPIKKNVDMLSIIGDSEKPHPSVSKWVHTSCPTTINTPNDDSSQTVNSPV